jgi:hypothetical protein
VQDPSASCGSTPAAKALTLQRGSYDSLARLNLLLGLMTLRANQLDRERHYAEIIRSSSDV